MKPNDDPSNHRKARFRGNSAGRQACLVAQRDIGEQLAETFAAGVIDGAVDFLSAAHGDMRVLEALRSSIDRITSRADLT